MTVARSLYRRIYFHFLGVLVCVAAVSSWIIAGGWPGNPMLDAATRLTFHVTRLLVEAPDPAARRREAARIANELDLDLSLYDSKGNIVTHRGERLPPLDAKRRRVDFLPRLERAGSRWFMVATLVPADEDPLTLQCVPTSLSSRGTPFRKAGALVGLLMLVALAVRPLARRISRPVERIIEASRRFGSGDLSTRVHVPYHRLHRRHRWRRARFGDELFTLMHAWNDMAERIERQVSAQRELLANVSHELRSPLARVRVALALLPDDEGSRQRIVDIEADLAELDQLIEDVLQTSRLEATGLPNHVERFAVATLFDELEARAAADPLTAQLTVTVDGDAPHVVIEADHALLRRALFNAIENAAKYGAAPVTLGVELTKETVTLTVSDRGPGIPAPEREHVLQPFARGDKAHTPGKRSGVGLGLSFAARVAVVHGGKLSLRDAPQRGLTVCMALPTTRVVI